MVKQFRAEIPYDIHSKKVYKYFPPLKVGYFTKKNRNTIY